jgi:hypothetical protein
LDFSWFACHGYVRNSDGDFAQATIMMDGDDLRAYSGFSENKKQIGTVGEILGRQSACALCHIVAKRLVARGFDDGKAYSLLCSAISVNFCGMDMETRPKRYTQRMAILIEPYTDPLPLSVDDRIRDALILVELQVCGNETFCGREMDQKEVDFGLLSSWLRKCLDEHKADCRLLGWDGSGVLGLLVIDVCQMCIIEAPPQCRYSALSYCWGEVDNFKHERGNSAVLRRDGGLKNAPLPKTVSDAILLIQSIGERYLWVDALCIVQDDPISSHEQISQMGSIYLMAIFTIVAAAGQDANAGLPGVRPWSRTVDQESVDALITAIDGPYYSGEVRNSTWSTRGWTMQEEALSARRLIFTESQVYWRCREAIWLEETILESAPPQKFHRLPPSQTDTEDLAIIGIKYGAYRMYENCVLAYGRRQLKYESDILRAFMGITSAISQLNPGALFNWGLPQSRFHWALGWVGESCTRNTSACTILDAERIEHIIRFPSWSWTGWFSNKSAEDSFRFTEPGDFNRFIRAEIIFYEEDVLGQLHQIHDTVVFTSGPKASGPSGQVYSRELAVMKHKWKGQPREIQADQSYQGSGGFQHKLLGGLANLPLSGDYIGSGKLHFWTSVAPFNIISWAKESKLYNPAATTIDAVSTADPKTDFDDVVIPWLDSSDSMPWQPISESTKISYRPRRTPSGTVPGVKGVELKTAFTRWRDRMQGVEFADDIGRTMTSISDPNDGLNIDHSRYGRREAPPDHDYQVRVESYERHIDLADLRGGFFTADLVIIGRSVYEPVRFLKALIVRWENGVAYRIGFAMVGERDWVKVGNRQWKRVILG